MPAKIQGKPRVGEILQLVSFAGLQDNQIGVTNLFWWPGSQQRRRKVRNRPHHTVHVAFDGVIRLPVQPAAFGIDGLPFQPSFSVPIVSRRHEHDRGLRAIDKHGGKTRAPVFSRQRHCVGTGDDQFNAGDGA